MLQIFFPSQHSCVIFFFNNVAFISSYLLYKMYFFHFKYNTTITYCKLIYFNIWLIYFKVLSGCICTAGGWLMASGWTLGIGDAGNHEPCFVQDE